MPNRHNIVLLVGEDTGLHLGCYGQREAHTPNLDRLASQGTRYTHGYSVGPVCAPSRCCMVTGSYPWSIGTHHMRSTLKHPPRLFTQELQDAGYHVSWPTKMDFNFEPPADFATSTESWWETGLPRKPFFAYRNFQITHESSLWDVGARGREYQDWVRDLPAELRIDPSDVDVPAYLPDVPEVRLEISRYFQALALQDLQVGQTLEAIERSGMASNTVVIYLTDHGRGLAREKRWCYDAGLHLPLIIRWPGTLAAGAVEDRVVSWVDLAPTVLAIAGAAIPEHYQGQTIFQSDRRYAISGRDRMDEQFDRVRTVTDGRYRYIRNDFPHLPYAQRNMYQENQRTTQALRRMDVEGTLIAPADVFMQPAKPAEELYDAETDRDMVWNLAGDPAHAGKLRELKLALEQELGRFGDLGMVDETELIERGLVVDRLAGEFRPRIQPLPPEYAARSGPTYLTLNEAEAAKTAKN
jgi:N-sulfoglucosamine sulfohydrolase